MFYLFQAFQTAAKLSPQAVFDACQAKPLLQDDQRYRSLFLGATTLRQNLSLNSKKMQAFDLEATKFVRTKVERILQDYIKPAVKIAFWIMMIVLLIDLPIFHQ